MMINRVIVVAFLLLSFVSSKSLTAQSNLSFGASGVQHEDTLHIGDSIHFTFWLINQGNGSISDSIFMSCETFDDVGVSISSMSIGDIYNTAAPLNVGDSILVSITEEVTYSSYVLGDNIVVIWPGLFGPGSVDTSMTYIHILDSVSVGSGLELPSDKLLVFPNPVSEHLYFNNKIDLPISSIHISDAFGNIVFKESHVELNNFRFNVSTLKQGIYFVVIRFNNREIIKKIIIN